jgi:phosphate-selective porin
LQLTLRYESLDYNLDTGYRDNTWKGVGANYYIDGQKLKVSAEYAKVEYDKQHPTDPSQQDYKQFTLGLQFIF